MGPNFDRADRKIGRKRLPQGYVAVLDDAELLREVICEMHSYGVNGRGLNRPQVGVLFRKVSAAERDGINHRLVDHFGPAELLDKLAVYGIDEEYHHVIDSRGIAHAWNRHADPLDEARHGQVPIELADFQPVPAIIRPGNIVEFREAKGTPRIVYEERAVTSPLVVVLEIQRARKWLVVKTVYRRK